MTPNLLARNAETPAVSVRAIPSSDFSAYPVKLRRHGFNRRTEVGVERHDHSNIEPPLDGTHHEVDRQGDIDSLLLGGRRREIRRVAQRPTDRSDIGERLPERDLSSGGPISLGVVLGGRQPSIDANAGEFPLVLSVVNEMTTESIRIKLAMSEPVGLAVEEHVTSRSVGVLIVDEEHQPVH